MGRGDAVREAVLAWPGVTERPHRFGGREFRLGRREIGHVHGDALVDIPLPRRERDAAVASGRAEPHHVLPDSGWVSVRLRSDAAVADALALLALSLEIARAGAARRA